MTFDDLRDEYIQELIGPRIFGLVKEICGIIARRYPEVIYNGALAWDASSIDDLSQEVVLNQLLGEQQVHYIFDTATSVESVRRLLTHQAKRALSARRKVTPIDRLMSRISELARGGEIELVESTPTFYRARASQSKYQPLGNDQINACVRAIARIPRLDSRLDTSRETMIYTPGRLRAVVEALFEAVPAVSEKELRTILELLLTPWTPASLVPMENDILAPVQGVEATIEETQMAQSAKNLAESFTHEERVVLILKSQNIADSIVATEIGVSRPTVANIKKTVLDRVRHELIAGVSDNQHELAIQSLLDECNFLSQGM